MTAPNPSIPRLRATTPTRLTMRSSEQSLAMGPFVLVELDLASLCR